MYRVTVKSDQTTLKQGVSAKTQKPYRIVEQEGWIELIDGRSGNARPYPERFVFGLDDNQPPYPVGTYVLDPGVVYVDRFSGLSVGRVKLLQTRPAAAAAPVPQAKAA